METSLLTKKVFTGVDYLRLTSPQAPTYDHWLRLLEPEMRAERDAGRRSHQRGILGYYGPVGEHFFCGLGEQGAMLQLSGAAAHTYWREASRYSMKATRLDVQVTWPVDDEPGLYVREMYQIGQLQRPKNGHPPALEINDTPSGAKMLTSGRRPSELYGRMYDKYRESKQEDYKGCVRWEVEIKGDQAIDLLRDLREAQDAFMMTRTLVHQFWTARGMQPFWEVYEGMSEHPPVKRTKTDETKLAWFINQVRPTVLSLKEHGRVKDAIRALLDDVLTPEQVDGILLLIEQERGD
jgi:Replication initiation factor